MSTRGVSDPELVERARRGDDAAFGTLVDRHRTAVFRAALAALGTREDAEEVAQEAFVAAFRHLQDFREDASFKTWLLSIAWRKALTRRRTVRTFLRRFVQPPEDTEWQVPDAGRTQEQAVLDNELHGHIRREIARLAPKFRDALLLASAGEHSYNDIAGMLGIPVGTLKWRVNEARRQLRGRLAGMGYGQGLGARTGDRG
ncbi:MAG: RNA polymerase sigma factor [Vicinamibacterales bacterium]|nr:RNA polymerase sigma factor [Vicinamibacterales bacterium]